MSHEYYNSRTSSESDTNETNSGVDTFYPAHVHIFYPAIT